MGFAQSTRRFYDDFLNRLSRSSERLIILNPWAKDWSERVHQINKEDKYFARLVAWKTLNHEIGRHNRILLDECDMVIAILDGVDVDSGTAAEIGYAHAKGKFIMGLRTDMRQSGDNLGSKVNLQVEYFIHDTGGEILDSVDELFNHRFFSTIHAPSTTHSL